ncbi:MAG: HAD-IA family hydrolase [Defluviitaleaceae bacterium]|nr:HAD-IA family hydrolase [Defluviitaleaceae bacterium]
MLNVTDAGEVSGHLCGKGITYGREELTNPTRNVTTSVRIRGGLTPMLSVKTARPIPKGKIMDAVREVHTIVCEAPFAAGDVVLRNAADTGVDFVATRNVPMRAYIFDLDGTILDSARVWNKVNRAFFEKRGIPFPMDYQQVIAAMPFPQVALYTKETYGLPETPEELMKEFLASAVDAYTNDIEMKPGAKEYILRLHANGHKLAVATAAPPEFHVPALKNHGIFDLYDVICTTQDVAYGKTRPDVFLLAAKKLNAKPGDCVVFDDILPAVKSAKSAGMTVCAVYDGQDAADWEEIKRLADHTLTDFKDALI